MDDNARPHRANIVNDFFVNNEINRMVWPALSPDINPIEHMWDALQRRLSALPVQPTTRQELIDALVAEWREIPVATVNNLLRSMPRRCQEVVRSRGGPTHY